MVGLDCNLVLQALQYLEAAVEVELLGAVILPDRVVMVVAVTLTHLSLIHI